MGDALAEHLLGLVGRAASLSERHTHPGFTAVPTDGDTLAARRRQWCHSVSGGDEEAFEAVLARRGIEDPDAWLVDVEVADPARLPAWVDGALWLFGDIPPPQRCRELSGLVREELVNFTQGKRGSSLASDLRGQGRRTRASRPGSGVFVPVFLAARRHATAHLGAPGGPEEALNPLAAQLVGLLSRSIASIVRVPGPDGRLWRDVLADTDDVAATWMDLTAAHPALVRAMGIYASHWRDATAEMLGRLDADASALDGEFFGGDMGGLVRIRPGQGDPHGGHRTVTLVETEGGTVVYKPRPLEPVAEAGRLVGLLAGDDPPVRFPDALVRDGYGWEKFVATSLPVDDEGWDALASAAGRVVRLLSAFGATDMTDSNVVVTDGRFCLIDTETLLSARLELPGETAPDDLYEALRSVGFVTASAEAERRRAEPRDHGVLASPELRPLLERAGDVLEGFCAAHRELAEVLGDPGRAAEVASTPAELPVRVLLRSSWLYDRLLSLSFEPSALGDGISRELVFERLWTAHVMTGVEPTIVSSEVASLLEGDLPAFEVLAGSQDLRGCDGTVLAGAFAESPAAHAGELMGSLAGSELVSQRDLLASLLHVAGPEVRPRTFGTGGAGSGSTDAAEVAGEVAADLAASLAGPEGEEMLARLPWNGATVLTGPRADLYSGICGLAVVLAEAGHAPLAEPMGRRVAEVTHGWLERLASGSSPTGEPPDAGAYVGLGAALWCLGRLSESGWEWAGRERDSAVAVLDALRLPGEWSRGLVTGTSGLAVVLARSGHPALAGRVLAHECSGEEPAQPVGAPPGAWPSVEAGVALARAALGEAVEIDVYGRSGVDLLVAVGAGGDAAAVRPSGPGEVGTAEEALVAIELSLECHAVTGEGRYLEYAQRLARTMADDRARHGRWFPQRCAADAQRVSALWGVGAVAHVMAGIAAPHQHRSLWLLR